MEKRRRIFMYGKSVILGTVGASLQNFSELEIIRLSPPLPDALELGALAPDVIIFDVQAAHPDQAFSLLRTLPNLMLIGIDPGSDQVIMWSGKQLRDLSTQELVKAIANNAPDSLVFIQQKE